MLHLCSQRIVVLGAHDTFLEETVPTELLHGSKHFDNVDKNNVQRDEYQSTRNSGQLPRDMLK